MNPPAFLFPVLVKQFFWRGEQRPRVGLVMSIEKQGQVLGETQQFQLLCTKQLRVKITGNKRGFHLVKREVCNFDIWRILRKRTAQAVVIFPIKLSTNNHNMKLHSGAPTPHLAQKVFHNVKEVCTTTGCGAHGVKLVNHKNGLTRHNLGRRLQYERWGFFEAKLFA